MGHLLYVTERESRLCFLVDTVSEVIIRPPSKAEWKNWQDTCGLLVVNNLSIVTYGTRSLTLNLGPRLTFWWVFTVANLGKLILGADFLKYYGLVVDMRHRQLLDIRMQLSVQGIISLSPSPSPTLSPKKPTNNFTELYMHHCVLFFNVSMSMALSLTDSSACWELSN